MPSWYDTWADRYAELSTGVSADVPFYVGLALEADGPLVELAVGTGRVAIPVAQATRRLVVGIDSSRGMLEQARLRALSLGYLGLLAVVIVGTLLGAVRSGALSLLTDLFVLAVIPLLVLAFSPPVWLRRIWRQPEEDEFRHALHDLLLYSPDRVTLAQRALGWAARLVGGEAAFVIDSDGSVLAARGIGPEDAHELTAFSSLLAAGHDRTAPWREGPVVVLPLDLRHGPGAMVIISGRLTPLFGDDEMSRLRQYATSISAGLDRVALNIRIYALEKAKSEFLNVASHELRGPITVIKGYLTMLEGGALGELSPRASSVRCARRPTSRGSASAS